jgi:spermidine/putrescine transport system permease protein
MRSETFLRIFVWFYILMFFAYLFGPLILMSGTAFNSATFPKVLPWECFTVEWFEVLRNDTRLMDGLQHSLLIGFGVVLLAVPVGLAGALMLTHVGQRVRPLYYTIVISPILVPGVVLGISTLIFWDRVGTMFNAGYDSVFYDGTFLTVVGQATFVSAYCMLIFIARLERFDPAQEEAALDLGATNVQAFRKVLLPFLKPAVGSAAVLAFLASFENYNTTVFTIVSESTLTTVLASKVRYGINPSISALAVVIVVLTLIGALVHEMMRRREAAADRAAALESIGAGKAQIRKAAKTGNPAVLMVLVIFIAGLATMWVVGSVGVGQCKTDVTAEKKRITKQKVRERRTLEMFRSARPGAYKPPPAQSQQPKRQAPGTEGYQGLFAPGNLEGQVDSDQQEKTEDKQIQAPGTEGYRGIFDPGNLKGQAGADD